MSDLAAEIERHIPALRRYAWALLRNQDAADDLVQDCLERALGRWHLRRRDASTRAWLFTVLRNQYPEQCPTEEPPRCSCGIPGIRWTRIP